MAHRQPYRDRLAHDVCDRLMIMQLTAMLATVAFVGAGVAAPLEPTVEGELRHLAIVDVTRPFADPSPSPTLGSTPQPDRAPGDDNDGNASDYTQVPLAVVAPLSLGAIVGGSVIFYLIRRARRSRTPDEPSGGGRSGHR